MVREGLSYQWRLPAHADSAAVQDIAADLNIALPVAEVLYHRGYRSAAACRNFLFTPAEVVGDGALLKDAERAVERIIRAITLQEKILVAGDYDVDGVTSSALMMRCLRDCGAQINFFLPNRVRDGYGLSAKTVERAARNNYRLILTVDNGITAFDAAQKARECGIDLIITDHHRPLDRGVPEAYAIIDPHQDSCAYPFKGFAGVGVSFKLMSLLYKRLGREVPDDVYELLTLGTIADVVPLLDENRYYVREGLRRLGRTESFALRVLKENARLHDKKLSSLDIGFYIAPQINALGRLDDARDGVVFLLGSNKEDTLRVGKVLGHLNEARREIERKVSEEIIAKIESGEFPLTDALVVVGTGWQPGVIGLVASRVASKYGRPAIVLHRTADGLAKGSCRSIPDFNLFSALSQCAPMLISFGGHAMAAGVCLKESDIENFRAQLSEIVRDTIGPRDGRLPIIVDGLLPLSDIHRPLVHDLAYLEPFGAGNPPPTFYVPRVVCTDKPQIFKERHVKISIFHEGERRSVIFFDRPELYQFFCDRIHEPIDLVVHIDMGNKYPGTIELRGIDCAAAE